MKRSHDWQEQLRALLHCDLKSLYPLAREKSRKLIFYVGPTNSGKTYAAMQKLMAADCGSYLAPLRLLALENYETLKANEIPVSLITGEEEIIDEESAHVCSTIEMANFQIDIDVCVIDEVQMLSDRERGWAWVNAIVGIPAETVILTGSVNALNAIREIAKYLGEELEVVKFRRKNPLEMMEYPIPLKEIPPHTALITFSRSDVLALKNRLSRRHRVSVLYGNLSPEVRREEARRFRMGESDILVATDAIAMGLNLPIETLLFTTDEKFDGISRRPLTPNEVIQIAGRAGRYGHHESGYIGATSRKVLDHITEMFHSPLKSIKPPFQVKATPSQIQQLSEHLGTKNLPKILKFFAENMRFDGPFVAANIGSMIEVSRLIDAKKGLTLEEKYMLSQAPVSTRSPLIKSAFLFYVDSIIKKKVVRYKPSIKLKGTARTELELLKAEDEVKKISLYLWLSFKLPDLFPDTQKAITARTLVNRYCEASLKVKKLLPAKPKPTEKEGRRPGGRRERTPPRRGGGYRGKRGRRR
ncbi:MAG: RNA helicase [Campylobacteraceae bacterium 4484_4]|nr:MAG: RNA helicase [Campylobacteraceae bacterium 4484_4]